MTILASQRAAYVRKALLQTALHASNKGLKEKRAARRENITDPATEKQRERELSFIEKVQICLRLSASVELNSCVRRLDIVHGVKQNGFKHSSFCECAGSAERHCFKSKFDFALGPWRQTFHSCVLLLSLFPLVMIRRQGRKRPFG